MFLTGNICVFCTTKAQSPGLSFHHLSSPSFKTYLRSASQKRHKSMFVLIPGMSDANVCGRTKIRRSFSAPKWNSLWKLFLRAHSVFQEILGFHRLRKLFNHSPDFFSFAFAFLSLPWISINFNVISFFSDVSVQVLRPSRVCRFRVFLILLARPYCALIVPHREYEMICSLKWKNLKPQKLLRFHCWPKWCGVNSRVCLNKASGFMKMFTPIMKSGWKTFSAIKLGSLWSN